MSSLVIINESGYTIDNRDIGETELHFKINETDITVRVDPYELYLNLINNLPLPQPILGAVEQVLAANHAMLKRMVESEMDDEAK